jgi:hypothetical protein
MAIFGQYQGGMGQDFNVAGNMDAVLKQQAATNQSMLDAVSKFNQAREEMTTLQQQTGAILSQYGVDEKGKPDDTAPKYVHDLFKNVNKEGGIANLSRTQLVAGLKAYETGTQVDAQRQNQAFNAQKLRQATLTNDITEMQLQAAKKAEDDARRVREAYNNPEIKAAIDALSKEGTKQVEKVTKEIKIAGETVKFTAEEMSPLLDALNTAKESGNKNEQADAYDAIGKLLHSKTSKGQESITQYAGEDNGLPLFEDVKNPDYVPYRSARELARLTERKVGQDTSPTIPETVLRGIADKELAKFNTANADSLDARKRLIEADELKLNVGVYQKGRTFRENARVAYNNPETEKIAKQRDDVRAVINNLKDRLENGDVADNASGEGTYMRQLSPKEKIEVNRQLNVLRVKAETLAKQESAIEQQTQNKIIALSRASQPYAGGEVQASQDTWKPVIEKVKETYQKTLDEQTNDEFLIMKNYFEKTGGIPATFTKEAFYASKGIQRPMVVQAGGGYLYAQGPDGKGHFLEDKTGQSSQMSVTDQEKMWKAGEFSKARNINGLTVNGYTFRGEVRVGDIDQANKVKDGVFKTTRALSALDSLIDIAENKNMFEKLLPTEVSGIAQALANTVQAANRTEVGGSGAWSNQDQANIDKIIRDPSKSHNAVFTSQTVASLKAYRQRLEQSMVDSGSIYGFAFEKNGAQGTMSSQIGQFRIQYAAGMAKFGDEARALEYAKQSLNFDANE